MKVIKAHESGRKAEDICRELGVSTVTFYKWKQRYGGMEASDFTRLKDLEDENARLKKIYANLSLVHEALKNAVKKKQYGLMRRAAWLTT